MNSTELGEGVLSLPHVGRFAAMIVAKCCKISHLVALIYSFWKSRKRWNIFPTYIEASSFERLISKICSKKSSISKNVWGRGADRLVNFMFRSQILENNIASICNLLQVESKAAANWYLPRFLQLSWMIPLQDSRSFSREPPHLTLNHHSRSFGWVDRKR